ncbi:MULTISPECIES: prolipoprotein diacylglyceryl transferase [Chitinophagaceae]
MTIAYIHWDVDPTIFQLGNFTLRYYSLFWMLGIFLSYYIMRTMLLNTIVTTFILEKLMVYIVLATMIGARLGHCLLYEPQYFLHHPAEIFLPFHLDYNGKLQWTGYQGLASHGGAMGIVVAMALFAFQYDIPFLYLADRIALVVPVCGSCIRLGNLFNSEIIGTPTQVPWAFIFQRIDFIPRHPAQLYEACIYLAIFAWMLRQYKRNARWHKDGYLLGWILILVFSARFFIEFLKMPQEDFEQGMYLDMGQLLSLPFVLIGIWLLYRSNFSEKRS